MRSCTFGKESFVPGCRLLMLGHYQVVWPMRADEARIIRGAAAMQQVADWLEKIGLGQYAKSFAEN
jgi:hypothetical protein